MEEWNGRQHDLNGMGIKVNVIKYQALKENNLLMYSSFINYCKL